MASPDIRGYLVVLKEPEAWQCSNKSYEGIFRAPSWPPRHDEEQGALDAYVFDPQFKNEDALIPRMDKALELLGQFGASPRKFEVIYCEGEIPDATNFQTTGDHEQTTGMDLLGYDVAPSGGEFWSIVSELDKDDVFYVHLNAHGLFESKDIAVDYLRQYRMGKRPDHDMPFMIWRVWRVKIK